jgi:hypothetical protein
VVCLLCQGLGNQYRTVNRSVFTKYTSLHPRPRGENGVPQFGRTARSELRKEQLTTMAYPGNFFEGMGGVSQGIFSGGVQQIQLMTEGRENGDLGAVAP